MLKNAPAREQPWLFNQIVMIHNFSKGIEQGQQTQVFKTQPPRLPLPLPALSLSPSLAGIRTAVPHRLVHYRGTEYPCFPPVAPRRTRVTRQGLFFPTQPDTARRGRGSAERTGQLPNLRAKPRTPTPAHPSRRKGCFFLLLLSLLWTDGPEYRERERGKASSGAGRGGEGRIRCSHF